MNVASSRPPLSYEVPEHGTPPAEALEHAEQGRIVRLTRDGRVVATLNPIDPLASLRQYWADNRIVVREPSAEEVAGWDAELDKLFARARARYEQPGQRHDTAA